MKALAQGNPHHEICALLPFLFLSATCLKAVVEWDFEKQCQVAWYSCLSHGIFLLQDLEAEALKLLDSSSPFNT